MSKFVIREMLIYNPTLKPTKRKAIECDIQQAKIMAYYPPSAPQEQRWNTQGMAEGVYEFVKALSPPELFDWKYQEAQTILMDNCATVQKQVEQDIWIYLVLGHNIVDLDAGELPFLTEDLCDSILSHVYESFRVFYGPLARFIQNQKLNELQLILQHFVPTYSTVNDLEECRKLSICSYFGRGMRTVHLDSVTFLKMDHVYSVLTDYLPDAKHLLVFGGGMLIYTSLDQYNTEFFASYLYGYGEPCRFDANQLNRLKIIKTVGDCRTINGRYGAYYNCFDLVLAEHAEKTNQAKMPKLNIITNQNGITDLLSWQLTEQVPASQVYLQNDGQLRQYYVTYYQDRGLMYLTFYSQIPSSAHIRTQNAFYTGNYEKLAIRINETIGTIMSQSSPHRFLFINTSTMVGKSTIREWDTYESIVKWALNYVYDEPYGVNRNPLSALLTTATTNQQQAPNNSKQASSDLLQYIAGEKVAQKEPPTKKTILEPRSDPKIENEVAVLYQGTWIVGVRRLNRALALLIPGELPLNKLDEYLGRMIRDNFPKAFNL